MGSIAKEKAKFKVGDIVRDKYSYKHIREIVAVNKNQTYRILNRNESYDLRFDYMHFEYKYLGNNQRIINILYGK